MKVAQPPVTSHQPPATAIPWIASPRIAANSWHCGCAGSPAPGTLRQARCGSFSFRTPAAGGRGTELGGRPRPRRFRGDPCARGGGAAYRAWAESLPRSVAVVPMRTPRRNTMAELVAALCDSIEAHLDEPFAFFGHSMGAVVAFELARLLRRRNQPAPRMLVASGARAPQFRRGHVPPPEPSEAQFVEALRRLEGTPREVLDNPNLMQLILPALREDAAIYRNYIYAEEPPLDCPIRAYGGAEDPNVRREHLEGWAVETTAVFAVRVFPGGHFYLRTYRQEFLAALARDLTA